MYAFTSILAMALAGGVSAFTPAGFEPASKNNLTVAFGGTLAMNGEQTLRAITAQPPILGTTTKMTGTYMVMMVDPDIPPATAGGQTTELLHWMQADLTSANATTNVGGQKVYQLINVKNTSALATYLQPNPPDKAPTTHRYTQLLFNTTGMNATLASLATVAKTRGNFSAANVASNAKLTVLMGNSFNVSFADKGTGSNSTGTAASSGVSSASTTATTPESTGGASSTVAGGATSSAAADPAKSTGAAGKIGGSEGALFAGLAALGAAMAVL